MKVDNFDFMDAKKEDKEKFLLEQTKSAVMGNKMFYPHPLPPLVLKTRDEIIIDTCLDIVGLYGEEHTRKEMEIKYRLGIWEKPPCEK